MRCALSVDFSKGSLTEQSLAAWGELQSLNEDPSYKESDIKGEPEAAYFSGYKAACDEMLNDIENLLEDGEITDNLSATLHDYVCGSLAMQLFIILDHQEEQA